MGLLLRDARGVALLPWCRTRRDPRLPQHGGQGGGRAPVFVAPFATGTEATCTSCGGGNRAQNREKRLLHGEENSFGSQSPIGAVARYDSVEHLPSWGEGLAFSGRRAGPPSLVPPSPVMPRLRLLPVCRDRRPRFSRRRLYLRVRSPSAVRQAQHLAVRSGRRPPARPPSERVP